MSVKDLQRLRAYLGVTEEAFERNWGERRAHKLHIRSGSDGFCVFFVEGKGCSVHAAKPDICRAWPYFRGNLLDPASFAFSKDFCPGIPAGLSHERFRRQGLAWLVREGLAGGEGEDEANALRVQDLVNRF